MIGSAQQRGYLSRARNAARRFRDDDNGFLITSFTTIIGGMIAYKGVLEIMQGDVYNGALALLGGSALTGGSLVVMGASGFRV
jgi:hypothetical protein